MDKLSYWRNYADLINAPHLLVAGATGSGKSTFVHSLLYTLTALKHPSAASLILCDPKRVELSKWRQTRFCGGYADNPADIVRLLSLVNNRMDAEYSWLQANGLDHTTRGDIYIVIDELADLMTDKAVKEDCFRLLQRIAALGRAAKCHLICGTQAPSRAIIPAALTLNFTHKLGLRCDTAIESRQVINAPGCELLPPYGLGYLRSPRGLSQLEISKTADAELLDRQTYWKR